MQREVRLQEWPYRADAVDLITSQLVTRAARDVVELTAIIGKDFQIGSGSECTRACGPEAGRRVSRTRTSRPPTELDERERQRVVERARQTVHRYVEAPGVRPAGVRQPNLPLPHFLAAARAYVVRPGHARTNEDGIARQGAWTLRHGLIDGVHHQRQA